MTALTVIETNEVIESMTQIEAERITARIADKLDAIADNLDQVMPLIREALTREAWRALGYASPTAYVSERFKGALTRLPREIRQPVVAELAAAGMSTRAIAPIVGTSQQMVSKDLRDQVTTRLSPEPEAPEPTPAAPITGMDGKTYTRPELVQPDQQPAQPKRKPLPDAFWTARYDLGKKAETLRRLVEDDRFPANKKKVAEANLNDLLHCRDLLQQVINQLQPHVTNANQ